MTAPRRLVAAMLLAGAVVSVIAARPAGAHAELATAEPAPESIWRRRQRRSGWS